MSPGLAAGMNPDEVVLAVIPFGEPNQIAALLGLRGEAASVQARFEETGPVTPEDCVALGLVGPGNNGGDTLVALAHLAEKGWKARGYLVKRKAGGDPLVKRLEEADGEIYLADKDLDFLQLATFIETADVLMDGVLGTGFKLPLKADMARVLGAARSCIESMEWPPLVVAVDCPSGVECDDGKVAEVCLPADATITMAAVKQGLLKLPAYEIIGELRVVDIGPLLKWSSGNGACLLRWLKHRLSLELWQVFYTLGHYTHYYGP